MLESSEQKTAGRTSTLVEAEIGPSANTQGLPIRWVVLYSGNSETDDYYPTASRGEPDALTLEVSELCLAFHPVSQMNLFPKESAAFLFWRATSTRDWIVTRVNAAPNSEGRRTVLEYCSLIFDDATFSALRYNPFRTRTLNLHDRVRKHYLSRRREPFYYSVPSNPETAGPTTPLAESTNVEPASNSGHEAVILDIQRMIPGITEDHLSSDANVAAIQEYCSRWHDRPQPPPTFATWWSSRNPVPKGRFDVVLRAATPKAMTWHEAARSVAQLGAAVKLTLPNPPAVDTATVSLIRAIINTCAVAEQATNRAAGRLHTETTEETEAQLKCVVEYIKELTTQLTTVAHRFAGQLSAQDARHLTDLIDRSQDLQISLQLVVSHNPFQQSGHRLSEIAIQEAPPMTVSASRETSTSTISFAGERRSAAIPDAAAHSAGKRAFRWNRAVLPATATVIAILTLWLLHHR